MPPRKERKEKSYNLIREKNFSINNYDTIKPH
jgi:hypothetical protein